MGVGTTAENVQRRLYALPSLEGFTVFSRISPTAHMMDSGELPFGLRGVYKACTSLSDLPFSIRNFASFSGKASVVVLPADSRLNYYD